MGFRTGLSDEGRKRALAQRDEKKSTGPTYITGMPVFNPKDGENCIRILPPIAEDADYGSGIGFDFRHGYIAGTYFASPKTFDSSVPDPIADKFFELRETDPDAAAPYRTGRRTLLYVLELPVDPDQPYDLTVKAFPAAATLVDDIFSAAKTRNGAVAQLDDIKDGRPVFFDKKKNAGGIPSYGSCRVDSEPLDLTGDVDELLKQMVPVRQLIRVITPEEAEALISRQERRDAGSDEDDAPQPQRRVRSTSNSAPPPASRTRDSAPAEAPVDHDPPAPSRRRAAARPATAAASSGGESIDLGKLRERLAGSGGRVGDNIPDDAGGDIDILAGVGRA